MSENAPGERLTNEYNGSLCGRYSQSLANNPPISLPRFPSQLSLPTTMMTSPALPETLGRRVFVLFMQETALISAAMQMTVLIIFFIFVLFFWLQSYAKLLKTSNSKRSEYSRFVDAIY